jgi:glutamate-1-semialdehyde 2,1-aminomutase
MGALLRERLKDVLLQHSAPGTVVGECSVFHILLGEGLAEAAAARDAGRLLGARPSVAALRKAMLIEGVDLMRTGGFTSVAHGEPEVDLTVQAFDRALTRLQVEAIV